jgi:hypothetical protein
MPSFAHRITKEILERSIERLGIFSIEQSSYIDRREQFPEELVVDGREGVGAIAVKKQQNFH